MGEAIASQNIERIFLNLNPKCDQPSTDRGERFMSLLESGLQVSERATVAFSTPIIGFTREHIEPLLLPTAKSVEKDSATPTNTVAEWSEAVDSLCEYAFARLRQPGHDITGANATAMLTEAPAARVMVFLLALTEPRYKTGQIPLRNFYSPDLSCLSVHAHGPRSGGSAPAIATTSGTSLSAGSHGGDEDEDESESDSENSEAEMLREALELSLALGQTAPATTNVRAAAESSLSDQPNNFTSREYKPGEMVLYADRNGGFRLAKVVGVKRIGAGKDDIDYAIAFKGSMQPRHTVPSRLLPLATTEVQLSHTSNRRWPYLQPPRQECVMRKHLLKLVASCELGTDGGAGEDDAHRVTKLAILLGSLPGGWAVMQGHELAQASVQAFATCVRGFVSTIKSTSCALTRPLQLYQSVVAVNAVLAAAGRACPDVRTPMDSTLKALRKIVSSIPTAATGDIDVFLAISNLLSTLLRQYAEISPDVQHVAVGTADAWRQFLMSKIAGREQHPPRVCMAVAVMLARLTVELLRFVTPSGVDAEVHGEEKAKIRVVVRVLWEMFVTVAANANGDRLPFHFLKAWSAVLLSRDGGGALVKAEVTLAVSSGQWTMECSVTHGVGTVWRLRWRLLVA